MSELLRSVYRTHTCGVLRSEHVDQHVRLAGWVHRKRDHGQLLFIDLRDHYGVTQCVFTPNSAAFGVAETIRLEGVISVAGRVIRRTDENINPAIPTGELEVVVDSIEILSTMCTVLADKAIDGFTVNVEHIAELVDKNPIMVTGLNPVIGYDNAAKIAKKAYAEKRTVKDVARELTDLGDEELDRVLDPTVLADPGIKGGASGG